jgi:hypothetical protein
MMKGGCPERIASFFWGNVGYYKRLKKDLARIMNDE